MGTTDEPKGTNPSGEPPEGKKEPPTQPEKKYTQKDLEEEKHKALSAAGRAAAQLEKRESAIKAREEELSRIQKEREEAELKAAEDNPELLDALKLRKQVREERAQLAKEKAEHEREVAEHAAELAEAKETKSEIKIWAIAKKHEIDASVLKDKVKRYKLESDEDIDDLAQSIKKPASGTMPDSNISSGSGTHAKRGDPDAELIEGFRILNK